MLPRHARCVLSRLRCNGHSLLLSSYLSGIGRIENPSCSACGHSSQDTSHSSATLCLSTTSGPDPEELPGFWGSMVFRHAPIPRKGSGNQQQQHVTSLKFQNTLIEIKPKCCCAIPGGSSMIIYRLEINKAAEELITERQVELLVPEKQKE